MGAVQSILDSALSNPLNQDATKGKDVFESPAISWVSNKLHRDMSSKFTELELLSLRQVFQQLKQSQDSLGKGKSSTQSGGEEQQQEEGRTQPQHSKKNNHRLPGITESTFLDYLGFPQEKHRSGQLFFRSFFNLSVYPDNPNAIANPEQPHYLTVKDFIKPLALYCHKVNDNTLLDVKPLKAIFESFAEMSSPLTTTSPGTTSPNINDATITSTTDIEPPIQDLSLKHTKSMEDSLKDLTSGANFEWDPEDADDIEHGPSVEAMDLVDILDGILWLIQQIATHRSNADTIHPHKVSDTNLRHKASAIVEQIVQYSRSSSNLNTPIDLSIEVISFGMFSKYYSRNCPNVFEVLSQYFYSLFLIGNTLNPKEPLTSNKFVMPGVSCVPEMNAPSSIITPENLGLISWFLPLKKTSPTLSRLYIGSQNGFSMNQFEVHVCKYPAPTLLLLLVERQITTPPTISRRQSISFNNSALRHRHSVSSNSPTYSTWGSESRKSFDKLTGRSPTTPVSASGSLGTIFDEKTKSEGETNEPKELQNSPPLGPNEASGNAPANSTQKRAGRERLIVGAYVTETWRVSKSGWGNDSFALFELSPCFEVFPARKSTSSTAPSTSSRSVPINSRGKASLSSSSAVAGNQQMRHYIHFLKNAGVGFGGQASESCMLYMDDNLRYGSYRQDYAGGNIYMNAGGARQSGFEIDFEIVECEVWGLGGAEAKARQQKEWDFEQREANRRASIHLRGKGDQQIDMDLLEMAGIIDPDRGHRHARRQSAV
ncbi:Restriction of telomere capping protein 5 [Entomortierella beljakovae]|nr:Restriction of telomere capping protein 5 [Entomortierella beljakovae]